MMQEILAELKEIKDMISSMRNDINRLQQPNIVVEKKTIPEPSTSRTKAKARINESDDLAYINEAIQKNTPAGKKIKDTFKETFGKELQDARKILSAGHNTTHYDMEILVNGTWYTVEHKGSRSYKPIDPSLPPWTQGVQFYNVNAKDYKLGNRYARDWYDRFIFSGLLSRKYDVKSQIPSFDDWCKHDGFRCGDPKTPFGAELRSKFRGDGKTGGCFDERDEMTKNFSMTEEELMTMKDEILALAKKALSQKNYWLQIQGDIQGEFYCAWKPELKMTEITSLKYVNNFTDPIINVESDLGFPMEARLRWGKGQGLSNLRIDLR